MKESKNKEDDSIMRELSSTIIFSEKSDISFYEQYIDDKSVYSFVFITSIYHDKIDELKEHLKLQFHSNSKYNISREEYLSTKDEYFDKNFSQLNLKEQNNFIKEQFKPINVEVDNNNNLFFFSFFISLFPQLFQMLFINAINQEYLGKENFYVLNNELKFIKYLFLFCIAFKTFTEFINGKKIVVYGIYNGFMYRTLCKRLLSILMGFVQIFINFIIHLTFSKLVFLAENIFKCIEILCVFIVVSQFDNWIGGYYKVSSKELICYSRKYFYQICLIKKNKRCNLKFMDIILFLLFISLVLFSFLQQY